MGRPRQKLDRLGQADLVSERLKNEPPGASRERLLSVQLGLQGEKSLSEIAEAVGRSRAIIQIWFDRYREGGVELLCRRSEAPRGPQSRLTERARKELLKKLSKGSFRRAEDARVWLERQFGIVAKTDTVARWLGKLGARLKTVRPRHPGSSEAKRFEFRNQLARQLYCVLAANVPNFRKRPLRLWVADEGRFGLQPCHRRAWVARGVRAHKDSRCRYDWQYIWAALQIGGGGSEFFYTNKADGDMSAAFLKQISRRDPYAVHVVVWDGAGFHPENGDPRIPENVVVLRQPPYSPELNPVEKLWDMLRDNLCNRSWQSLDDMLDAATLWLEDFWSEPSRSLSLIGDGWMLNQANA